MALTSWPRAYFELSGGDLGAAAESVVTLTTRKLQSEYRSVGRERWWPTSPNLYVDPGKDSMIVSVRRLGRGVSVLVAPVHGWSLIDALRRRERGTSPRLLTLCEQVHSVLLEIPNIVGVRWYTRGATMSVGTPDELPW
jgi:hypothetical protein